MSSQTPAVIYEAPLFGARASASHFDLSRLEGV
jgi:hypothetical protein